MGDGVAEIEVNHGSPSIVDGRCPTRRCSAGPTAPARPSALPA
ncbi:hypothetical protein FM119_06235 [Mycetocola reblochoni REB411]|uniref:Uncharacterized protein n=1 Tax=Mycetocola reblochoni REB411 TaxID=1255698 RepID=A0A1R4J9L5_9MICO|nr:hypothetical protein FM119_06235 [Mycetocola reblochoni REB411]